MKTIKTTQTITTTDYILSREEAALVRYCLDYCYHRITVHNKCGAKVEKVDVLRKELAKHGA